MDNQYRKEKIRKKWKKPIVFNLSLKSTLGGTVPNTYEDFTNDS